MSHGIDRRSRPVRINGALARTVAEQMHVLAAPSRVQLLGELRRAPQSVGDLAAAVGMEPSAVSHQLAVLRHLGWVVGARVGRRVVYALHDEHVGELLDQAVFHVEHLRLGASAPVAGEERAS
jgi:ArsR family transcriptional regulator, nickel/cobalt-responsive transcriptional repressor